MTNIVYQAYGKNEVIYQTVYSIHTLLEKTKNQNFRIVVYTDKIDFVKKFFSSDSPICYELLHPDLMTKWKGPNNFHHRMKIEILKDCSNKYDGNILYLDGDTYFTKDIHSILEGITPQQSVMHIAEHNLEKTKDILAKKLYKFLKRSKIFVNGKEILLPKNFIMWNAGAIGFHKQQHGAFQSIIDYTDELYSKFPKHIMEQYAVSYFAHTIGKIVPCDSSVEHYWNQKDDFEAVIIPFFEKNKSYESYLTHKDEIVLPKRHYGRPRYTIKQKLKHKVNRLKYLIGIRA